MRSKFCHIGSWTRSLGQNEGIPCGFSRGHNFISIDLKICENVGLADFSCKGNWVNGSLGQNKELYCWSSRS